MPQLARTRLRAILDIDQHLGLVSNRLRLLDLPWQRLRPGPVRVQSFLQIAHELIGKSVLHFSGIEQFIAVATR
jgi:hypothetical protein